MSKTEEILTDNRKNISSRQTSRDFTFGFDNLLLKQDFSNDRDSGSQGIGFWMFTLSFSIKFMPIWPILLFDDKCAIFTVHKRLSEIFIWENRVRAAGNLVSPRHKIRIEWSKSSFDLSIYLSCFKSVHSFSKQWPARRFTSVDSLLSKNGSRGIDQPQSCVLWEAHPAHTMVYFDDGISGIVCCKGTKSWRPRSSASKRPRKKRTASEYFTSSWQSLSRSGSMKAR
jgi:hypothetical protein